MVFTLSHSRLNSDQNSYFEIKFVEFILNSRLLFWSKVALHQICQKTWSKINLYVFDTYSNLLCSFHLFAVDRI